MNELRKRFMNDYASTKQSICKPKVLVVAVLLPTGAIETITNTQYIDEKLDYYATSYDESFRLRHNPMVKIIGYMLV